MKAFIALVALVGLAACSEGEELATCKGPPFALNTGRWQATSADLQIPKILGRTE